MFGIPPVWFGFSCNKRHSELSLYLTHLKTQQTNRLVHIGHQNQRFYRHHLMDVNVCVNECDTNQIVVLQLPQINLLTNSGNQKSNDMCNGGYRSFLLLRVDLFELELGERGIRFGNYFDNIVEENLCW